MPSVKNLGWLEWNVFTVFDYSAYFDVLRNQAQQKPNADPHGCRDYLLCHQGRYAENIAWVEGEAASGTYRVLVDLFLSKAPQRHEVNAYDVRIVNEAYSWVVRPQPNTFPEPGQRVHPLHYVLQSIARVTKHDVYVWCGWGNTEREMSRRVVINFAENGGKIRDRTGYLLAVARKWARYAQKGREALVERRVINDMLALRNVLEAAAACLEETRLLVQFCELRRIEPSGNAQSYLSEIEEYILDTSSPGIPDSALLNSAARISHSCGCFLSEARRSLTMKQCLALDQYVKTHRHDP